jgi:hypothetical protein
MDELNKGGVRLYPSVSNAIIERYDFDEIKEGEYNPDRGLHLKNGVFHGTSNREILVHLQVYTDGVIAETISSTADSDLFIEDLLKWVSTEFGMNYHSKLVRQKLYYSELVVTAEVDLDRICEKLRVFAEHLSTLPFFGQPQKQATAAITFGCDGKNQSSFSFERRAGVPFADNRYYTRAALPTSDHMALLEEFEQALA